MTVQQAPLGELAEVLSGGTPKRSNPDFFDGDVPWVKIGDMLQGRIEVTDETISRSGLEGSSAKLLPAGTLLLSIFATIGRTATLGIDAATNQAIAGIRILDPGHLDQDYLRRYLEFTSHGLAAKGRGVAQMNINLSILRAHRIPLPPIEEQRRIAAILDAADALRAKRRQGLAKLDTLTQAIFIDMFGDPVSNPRNLKFELMVEHIESATYGTSKKASLGGELPVLRMGNITYEGQISLHDLKYIELDEGDFPKHTVQFGDVLFNRTNSAELVGKTAVYRHENPVAYAGYLVRLRAKPTLHPEYLGAFMNLPYTKQTLRSMCKSIVGMANINAREVQKITVPIPPINEQETFAKKRAFIEQQSKKFESDYKKLEDLFASLQQRAFRGEL